MDSEQSQDDSEDTQENSDEIVSENGEGEPDDETESGLDDSPNEDDF